jgi:hypothetical protein
MYSVWIESYRWVSPLGQVAEKIAGSVLVVLSAVIELFNKRHGGKFAKIQHK